KRCVRTGEKQVGERHDADTDANDSAGPEPVGGTTTERSGKSAGRADHTEAARPRAAKVPRSACEERRQIDPEGVETGPQQRLNNHRLTNRTIVPRQWPQRSEQPTIRKIRGGHTPR